MSSLTEWEAILPKIPTLAHEFCQKFPNSDGRGTKVAILDTGVDPGCAALQKTSDGKPKIVDIVDCSGANDVLCEKTIKLEEGKEIIGLTGRKLTLNSNWKISNNTISIGIVDLEELFPERLTPSLLEKKKKQFKLIENKVIAEIHQNKEKKDDKEIELLVEEAQKCSAKCSASLNWIVDVATWFDGTNYRAVIDTEMNGDFSNIDGMTDFDIEREYRRFGDLDRLNYGVHIYDEGRILSIVADCGSHGTHVASIVAAYHEDEPSIHGVAPGAQIISLRIGDAKVGSMETALSLSRAIAACKKHNVDVINMSYGEPCVKENYGLFARLANEVIWDHDVVFMASAGNNGPILSSFSCPGGSTSSIISVGAFLTPEMIESQYSQVSGSKAAVPYVWTSRGPSLDGANGVDICAPGGAITGVPQWCLTAKHLKNGTSMASPNAAGCAALLIGRLKSEGIPFTAEMVKTGICNTAASPEFYDGKMVEGNGVIQVLPAWEWMASHARWASELPVFLPSISNGCFSSADSSRGLYIIHNEGDTTDKEYSISLSTRFKTEGSEAKKIAFELPLILRCNTPWITCAPRIRALASGHPPISIRIHPRSFPLPDEDFGDVLYTEIEAYAEEYGEAGPLFRVPITIVRPIDPETVPFSKVNIKTGEVHRRLYHVGPNFMKAHIKSLGNGILSQTSSSWVAVNMVQHFTGVQRDQRETSAYYRMTAGDSNSKGFELSHLENGGFVELAIAMYGKQQEAMKLEVGTSFTHLSFPDHITLSGGEAHVRVPFFNNGKHAAKLNPSCTITNKYMSLKPDHCDFLKYNDARDELPDGSFLHHMTLKYKFHFSAATECHPTFPLLDRTLYDAEVLADRVQMVDGSGKTLAFHDYKPHKMVKCSIGDVHVSITLAHSNFALLKKLKEMACVMNCKMEKTVTCPIHTHKISVITGESKARLMRLNGGQATQFVVEAPTSLEGANVEWFSGLMKINKSDDIGKIPVQVIPMTHHKTAAKKNSTNNENVNETKKEKTKEEKAKEKSEAELMTCLKSVIGTPLFDTIFEQFILIEDNVEFLNGEKGIELKSIHLQKMIENTEDVSECASFVEALVGLSLGNESFQTWSGHRMVHDSSEENKEASKKAKAISQRVCDSLTKVLEKCIDVKRGLVIEEQKTIFENLHKELKQWQPSNPTLKKISDKITMAASLLKNNIGEALKTFHGLKKATTPAATKQQFDFHWYLIHKLQWREFAEELEKARLKEFYEDSKRVLLSEFEE
eukprot:TRINITY_DN6394_c0_g2_i1.p1 TRINITY_DN6394_c0_g2~~TRINITY_DN6394_c0_g2_i1.p1  ORF type:complete len:1269 (-),score=399.18 TRINITY_DN6394_c0_g2_i1:148-3918(-)